MYRTVLNCVLGSIIYAGAPDWLELLAFPEKALDWTEEDESRLSDALKEYVDDSASQEVRDCSTLDEMTTLRGYLGDLSSKFDVNLRDEIDRLDDEIAEQESPEDPEEGSGFPGHSSSAHPDVFTEEDARQMFRTLSDNG